MSSITELEFIQLLHQTRIRFSSKPNSKFRTMEHTTGVEEVEDESDQGLIMKLDSRIPINHAKVFDQSQSVPGFTLSSASILQTISDLLLKKINQLTKLVEMEGSRLLPILLYISLMILGFQAIAVVVLLSSALLPVGLWFLLSCIGVLIGLYLFTYYLGQSQTPTPSPTPSQSSTSLSSYTS